MEPNKTAVNFVYIKDMNLQYKSFDCEVIVLQLENEPTGVRDGDIVYKFLVADRTGSIVLTLWGAKGSEIKNGDILRLSGVHCKLRNGHIYICTPAKCKLKRVGQDTFPFVEKPNLSEKEYPNPFNNNNNNNNNNINRGYRPPRINKNRHDPVQ